MKPRILLVVLFLTPALPALIAWLTWPDLLLRSAAHAVDELYYQNRPFAYRWNGLRFPEGAKRQNGCVPVAEEKTNTAELAIARAEKRAGASARSLQLSGRIDLLLCQPASAIAKYSKALLRHPEDPSLNLELGIAYALDAGMDPHLEHEGALDYEAAMEAMLGSGRRAHSAESLFDSALLFEEAQLPRQALERWRQAARDEGSEEWRVEDKERGAEVMNALEERRKTSLAFTSSPEAFLAQRDEEAAKGAELALNTATEDWLPKMSNSANFGAALRRLGDLLLSRHQDRWLKEMIQSRPSQATKTALENLSQAVRANLKGEHAHAAAFAHEAEEAFRRSHNHAGALRARIETVYSLDRRSEARGCLAAVDHLASDAMSHGYTWIAAQARLEEITCDTRTRQKDVIEARQKAYHWIMTYAKYEGLGLRALGFLTEEYVSADGRLKLWSRGETGLRTFWRQPLPALRGYALYYTLSNSAGQAGHPNAAIALLRESILLIGEHGHTALQATMLSYLGALELKARLTQEAETAFREMEEEYRTFDQSDVERFVQESEVVHAAALLSVGQREEGLRRLRRVTGALPWPYEELVPNVRRLLLPALGNAYLGANQLMDACSNYQRSIEENLEDLRRVHDRAQRDNALREAEAGWRGMTEVEIRLGHPREALKAWEEFRSSRRTSAMEALREIPGCSSSDAPILLPIEKDVNVLVYAFLPGGGLSAWMVNGTAVERHWIDDPSQARALALRLTELAARRESPPEEISAVSRELYRLLLGPFAKNLPHRGTMAIDADGVLAGVPWSVLEDQNGVPLIERFAFCQSVGLAEVLGRRRDPRFDFSKTLIFGPPALAGELAKEYPYLPDALREAETLHLRLPGSILMKKDEATAEAFRKYAEQAKFFHFAGHGISFGGFGALLLASSGEAGRASQYMSANDIASLNLSEMELVVLSACSSGVGERSGIVNLDGLTRAFLEAGASRVVAANWNVDSTATADLMIDFYDHLGKGERPAEALRLAEITVRRAHPQPYFWAGFRVFGEP